MDENRLQLLASLRVLGRLQVNDRLATRGARIQVQVPSLFNPVLRWWNKENREHNIGRVRTILRSAFCEVEKHMADKNPSAGDISFLQQLQKELGSAEGGLRMLSHTYNRTNADIALNLHVEKIQEKRQLICRYLQLHDALSNDSTSSPSSASSPPDTPASTPAAAAAAASSAVPATVAVATVVPEKNWSLPPFVECMVPSASDAELSAELSEVVVEDYTTFTNLSRTPSAGDDSH